MVQNARLTERTLAITLSAEVVKGLKPGSRSGPSVKLSCEASGITALTNGASVASDRSAMTGCKRFSLVR